MRTTTFVVGAALLLAAALPADAVVSSRSVPSQMGGNGHNVTFDGRLYVIRTGIGWEARLLRPEAITYASDGLPDAEGPMWSPPVTILTGAQPELIGENALAICEADPARAPYRCDDAGDPAAAGPYDCYDVWIIDSDASIGLAAGGQRFRRRQATFWVQGAGTADAAIHDFALGATTQLATSAGGELHGIEATVTRDGKLMVWNGEVNNGEQNGHLMYSLNANACAASGWSPPRSLSHMVNDSTVAAYRLSERTLRAADGTAYADGAPVYGAYPWLLPSGDGVMFSAAPMPCRAVEDPPGCGPRRNATSFLGYPTNWGLAVIDGGVNPSTDDTVRLFFSSPGPDTFDVLPTSSGVDVWPFFGSNTSNYVEVNFDDGLDGRYAGYWHMNEVVGIDGELDRSRTGDVSGYFNTARIPPLPVARDLLGSTTFPGSGAGASIADEPSLDPTGDLSLQLTVRPTAELDCDGNNNWRVLALKGDWATQAYSLVLEESRFVQARVWTAGNVEYAVFSTRPLPLGVDTVVGVHYDAATGDLVLYLDGTEAGRTAHAPAGLRTAAGPLQIGGPSSAQPACPDGLGTFAGAIDDVDVSTADLTPGAVMPAVNNGWLGKAVELDGRRGWLEVPHAASLEPVNAITMEMRVRPASEADCDGNNNYRVLLDKGASYSLVLEESMGVRARVGVAGGEVRELYSGAELPVGVWTHVAASYDAGTGTMAIRFDGVEVATQTFAPAVLEGAGADLSIGGRGIRAACPDGDGDFAGTIDEVAISRIVRDGVTTPGSDAGPQGPDAGNGANGGAGGCCDTGGDAGGAALLLLMVAAARTAAPGRRRRRS